MVLSFGLFNSKGNYGEFSRTTFFTVIVCVFLGAAGLKISRLADAGLSLGAGTALAVDSLVILCILIFHKKFPRSMLIFCGLVFIGFSVYHYWNLGKPCGCFRNHLFQTGQ